MNVHGQAVAQAKLEALIEAAQRATDYFDLNVDAYALKYGEDYLESCVMLNALRAAIAEARKPDVPEPEGDVVERARLVLVRVLEHDDGVADADEFTTHAAKALNVAGLLARPVDRERLTRVCAATLDGVGNDSLWVDAMAHRLADAILREVGR